jgi:very-short-patch-repair endonuclease
MTSESKEKLTFATHPKAKYWSDRNILQPHEFALNSHKKCWFNCDCGHEFESNLLNINQTNNWCPYCGTRAIKLCDNNNCDRCFNNSFASHPKAVYWHEDNTMKPREVFKSCDKKVFKFNCDKCEHKISIILKQISSQGHWCSYCSHQKLCDNEKCYMCFQNSFASVERSKYLVDKKINPRQLFKSTNNKYAFECDICNQIFDTQLSSVTKGVWCRYCFNKTEKILFDKLVKMFPTLKRQFKIDWCKDKKHLPFDFVIEDKKLIIEQDGPQHFVQIGNWQTPEVTKINDLYKMKCANEKGYSIIRILQKDVFHNRYDWLPELINNIEKIINEGVVQNIYMCKKDEYKNFDIIL